MESSLGCHCPSYIEAMMILVELGLSCSNANTCYCVLYLGELSTSLSGTSVRCDPLQGKNVWGTLHPMDRKDGDHRDRSVIMAVTRVRGSWEHGNVKSVGGFCIKSILLSYHSLCCLCFCCCLVLQLDANSFFHDLSFGAETSTTGLVTLLATIEALGEVKKKVCLFFLILNAQLKKTCRCDTGHAGQRVLVAVQMRDWWQVFLIPADA